MQITRNQIIVGHATELNITYTDSTNTRRTASLGPTLTGVTIRRETELMDITNDMGVCVHKIRTSDKFMIETELAENTLTTINHIWAESTLVTTANTIPGLANITTLTMNAHTTSEPVIQLVLQGPGIDGKTRTYSFPRVVSMVNTSQTISKQSIMGLPIAFEALPTNNLTGTETSLTSTTRPQQKTSNTATFGTIIEI